ncbi:MAG: hypothetical protein GF381_01810 [Candidatus Pacebacteria bacterium]|nr:hypothetical protein [Candidatus Paceibacterota bacterium]
MGIFNQSDSLRVKYSYQPWSELYPDLFSKEAKLLKQEFGSQVKIEHIGSTAVRGLGGKGVIDIMLIVQLELTQALIKAKNLDYQYRPSAGTSWRHFFQKHKPDQECQLRRYHLHLFISHQPQAENEIREMIQFRSRLQQDEQLRREYDQAKQRASQAALLLLPDKEKMKESYHQAKQQFFRN